MPLFDELGMYIPGYKDRWTVDEEPKEAPKFNPGCWLAKHGRWEGPGDMPACDGTLRKCHLVSRQFLARELASEVSDDLIWDERVWVWGCGGPMGNAGHHGHFDSSKRLRVPRAAIPKDLEDLMKTLKLDWWLDETYRRRARNHGARRGGRAPE